MKDRHTLRGTRIGVKATEALKTRRRSQYEYVSLCRYQAYYCSEPHRQQIVINRISISQPSPEILTESVRSATYIWRYVAKNDFYRQNAFFFIFDME